VEFKLALPNRRVTAALSLGSLSVYIGCGLVALLRRASPLRWHQVEVYLQGRTVQSLQYVEKGTLTARFQLLGLAATMSP
jgi:branched-subunit amino acid transport protein